jgi:DNA-binding CsgD family transcriptional regulator/tetratricopeptide (TPR) repeat protein
VHLLGRDADLGVLTAAVAGLGNGEGGVVLVRGPAGIGKTALLDHAEQLAAAADVRILRATGGELEREFPYGVVRQLFEPLLRNRSEQERDDLLRDGAAMAGPVVAPYLPAQPVSTDTYAVLHGLYWLSVNLAADRPLLLLVDDAHWADIHSVRFLAHLGRRISGLPVTVVVAWRSGESAATDEVLSVLDGEPAADTIALAALPIDVLGDLVSRAFGEEAEPAFVTACYEATGGNPFLALELARAMVADGHRPVAAAAARAAAIGPATVAGAVMARLARLRPGAAELARAVAVLGPDARLGRAAVLAGLDPREAGEIATALADARVFDPEQVVAFAHPILRTSVYQGMSATSRSSAHARAADLLAEERADPDAVASHLLACEPEGRADVVDHLRRAAARARGRGAPDSAAIFLRRALREGARAADEADLVFELAMAEKLSRDPDAAGRLAAALELATEPSRRAEIACELSETFAATGRWEPSMAVLEEARAELAGTEPEVSVRLETQFATAASWDPRRVRDFDERRAELIDLANGGAARRLALTLAATATMRGESEAEALALLERGLDHGRYLAEDGPESLALQLAGSVLVNTEDLTGALRLATEIISVARTRGSAYGFVNGVLLRARVSARAGDLAASEGDLRTALEVSQEHQLLLGISSILLYGADAWAERAELEDLAQMAFFLPVPEGLVGTPIGMVLSAARGRARLMAGDVDGAVEDLRAVGEVADQVHYRNPNALSWRSPLALALVHTDHGEAVELAETELDQARGVGRIRAIGVALRTLGVVEGGRAGLAHLDQAVKELAESPARLEHARALLEYGAALRRLNQRNAAREPLRRALDEAHRCGATRLVDRARTELVAAGARPRRTTVSGVDALTPSERRIAEMATRGMTNPEIAQALFVSLNTVETHLRHVFRKLDIRRRTELAEHL